MSVSVGSFFSALRCIHIIVGELSVRFKIIGLSVHIFVSPSKSLPFIASQVVSHAFNILAVLIYRYQYAHSSVLFSLSLRMLLWHFPRNGLATTSCFHMSTDYIFAPMGRSPLSCACRLLVVERFSVRDFAADYPLQRHLGFNHMPSNHFFLLSQHSRLELFALSL